jgi:hypothetical protein
MRLPTPRAIALLALTALAALAACRSGVPAPAPAPNTGIATRPVLALTSGEAVVAAMHDRYVGRWFHTATFKQKTSRLLTNGTWDVQTWYEAMKLPGRLRIDFAPLSAGNGVLYARDSQFVIQRGRVVGATPGINDLLLLGFDVYANPPARTVALLRRQGFDLSRVHAAFFEGRPAIVVGALEGDLRRKQFWIDAERLLFVRLVEPAPRDSTKVQDIRFRSYEPHGDAWIAPRVELFTGNVLSFIEEYSDIRTEVPLDDDLFEPSRWKTAKHWAQETKN